MVGQNKLSGHTIYLKTSVSKSAKLSVEELTAKRTRRVGVVVTKFEDAQGLSPRLSGSQC